MIVGIGVDLVSVARIAEAMRKPGFLPRILTEAERAYAITPAQVAGRWAAKEAVAKALGTHLKWHDVVIENDADGKPTVQLAHATDLNLHVSISHERDMAVAFVVVERP